MERSTSSRAPGGGGPGAPPAVTTEERAPGNILKEEPSKEMGDYRGLRKLWQEKLDEALARKEQEEYAVSLFM